jgi:hypothetical protein
MASWRRPLGGSRFAECRTIVRTFGLSIRATIASTASMQLRSKPVCITGKQRAVGIFGLSVFPEMRLTVSFRITYTLRPVWDAGTVSEDSFFFVPQRTARPLSFENILPQHRDL